MCAESPLYAFENSMPINYDWYLQNQLAEANIRIIEAQQGSSVAAASVEQAEVVTSISQELRQPMSSIVGYTDLLLGESVGILGALQRKFVERIKASTERIDNLINDLIREIVSEMGATAITITHDMTSVRKIADRVAMLHEGVIQWQGPVAQIDTTDNPYVHQFVWGEADGPVPFHYPAPDYAGDLLGAPGR